MDRAGVQSFTVARTAPTAWCFCDRKGRVRYTIIIVVSNCVGDEKDRCVGGEGGGGSRNRLETVAPLDRRPCL